MVIRLIKRGEEVVTRKPPEEPTMDQAVRIAQSWVKEYKAKKTRSGRIQLRKQQ